MSENDPSPVIDRSERVRSRERIREILELIDNPFKE
jgi:hypothetical protein